jgi:hypothetical protein
MSSSARRSEAPLVLSSRLAKTGRGLLDGADEDICPYAIREAAFALCKTRQIFLSLLLKSSYSIFAQRFPDDN